MTEMILITTHVLAVLLGAVMGGFNKTSSYVDQLQDAYDEGYRKGWEDCEVKEFDDRK